MSIFKANINKIMNIPLVFIKTIDKDVSGNKKTFTSLLTDSFEYVIVTEWNNSVFKNTKANTTVEIKNAYFSTLKLNKYVTQTNRKNIVLEMNTLSTVEKCDMDISEYKKYLI